MKVDDTLVLLVEVDKALASAMQMTMNHDAFDLLAEARQSVAGAKGFIEYEAENGVLA